MSLSLVRFEIAKAYSAALDHVHVSEFDGAFSVESIKRFAKKTPAVMISCLGVPSFSVEGTVVTANALWAAFCLVDGKGKEARGVSALLLAESVAVETNQNFWNDSASTSPKKVVGQNLYSKQLDKMGLAMWGIRWEQSVDLQRNAIETLGDFLTMHSTYYIGETDDADDKTDITTLPT